MALSPPAEWRVVFVAALLIAGTIGLSARLAIDAAQTEYHAAQTRLSQLLAIGSETLAYRLSQIDAVQGLAALVALAKLHDLPHAQAVVERQLQGLLAESNNSIVQVALADTTGQGIWASTSSATPKWNIADRPHFLAVVRDGEKKFVGTPVLGRVSHEYTTQFSWAVDDSAGQLVAVSVVSVRPTALTIAEDPSVAGGSAELVIARSDGIVVGAQDGRYIGQRRERVAEAAVDLPIGGKKTLSQTSVIDGRPRYVALTRLQHGLLVIAQEEVAVSQDATAAAQRDIWLRALAINIAIIAIAGAALLAVRNWRRAARAEARMSAQRAATSLFEQLAVNLSDAVALIERHSGGWQVLYATPSCKRVLGISHGTDFDAWAATAMPVEDWRLVDESLEKVRRSGQTGHMLFRVNGPDGDTWLDGSATLADEDDRSGFNARCVLAMRDVTASVMGTDELSIARRRLGELIANSPGRLYEIELSLGLDNQPRVTCCHLPSINGDASLAATQPGDVTDALGWHLDEPGYAARTDEIRRALLEGSAIDEFRVTLPDGSDGRFRDRLVRVRSSHHGATLSGYLTDITAEEAQIESLKRASNLISLGEMASGIAHELNQPLASIGLAAHNAVRLLDEPDGADRLRAKLDRIGAMVQRAAKVIGHIRSLSRGDTSRRPFSVAPAIDNAIMLLDAPLRFAQIQLDMRIATGMPDALGSAVGFEQVILNLIRNAIDAYEIQRIPPQSRVIRVAADATETTVQVIVSDRAGGIPDHIFPKLFTPFVSSKPHGKGVGLGLSLGYRMIHDMGGTIIVENRDGGAAFTIRLPVAPPKADAPPPAA